MQRLLSTYIFVSRRLTRELLGQIANAGFEGLEIFCSRSHFDYATKSEVQEMGRVLADQRLKLVSLHAPTSRDLSATREGGQPLSICEVERVRRIEAMDELKRAIDVAEEIPFSRMIFHMGGPRETADLRKRDAAFSSLEHLILHARHLGVTICVENTTSEMGAPAYLRSFVDETRLAGLRFNFDIGHAHLADGPEDEGVATSFEAMREHIVSAHIHDNLGDKDAHLPPHDGSIDWPAALKLFRSLPGGEIPLTLELKEKTGSDARSLPDQITAAARSLDRLDEDWRAF
jgi:sugar phosphate isomerase/epimerase